MKATGIVRHIDDLGRVVIPRELRKKLGIKEGEPLEIYTDTIGDMPAVCFAKYQVDLSDTTQTLQGLVKNYLDCDHPHKQAILMKLAEVDAMLKEKS